MSIFKIGKSVEVFRLETPEEQAEQPTYFRLVSQQIIIPGREVFLF